MKTNAIATWSMNQTLIIRGATLLMSRSEETGIERYWREEAGDKPAGTQLEALARRAKALTAGMLAQTGRCPDTADYLAAFEDERHRITSQGNVEAWPNCGHLGCQHTRCLRSENGLSD